MIRGAISSGAIALAAALVPAPSWADDQVTPDTGAAAGQVETVVVTAQRRQENLQNVPITVVAISSKQLEQSNVSLTADLPTLVPGFVAQQRTGSFIPFIRGVGSVDPNPENESIVSTYIDGVYVVSMPAGLTSLSDVQQIEVLKGPQGTLFGRNSVGGVVNIITKTPSPDFSGFGEVGYGNYDTVTARGYVTGELLPNFSADVSAVYQNQGNGWGKNITNGRDVGFQNYSGLRAKFYLDLPDTKMTLAADYSTSKGDNSVLFSPYSPGQILSNGQPYTGGFYDSNNLYPAYNTVRSEGLSYTLVHDFDFGELTDILAYRDSHAQYQLTQLNALNAHRDLWMHDLTEEFHLSSLPGSEITWIGGFFYLHHYAPVNEFDLSLPSTLNHYVYSFTTESLAGFGQVTVPLFWATKLTAGVRYTQDDQLFTKYQTTNGRPIPVPDIDHSKTYGQWTWRADLEHAFSDDVMGYVSYNRGYKSGVWNVQIPVPDTTKPETLDSFEGGIKSEFFDHSLRLNASAFFYDYKNMQYNIVVNSVSQIQNAASAKIQGLDLDASYVPIDNLTINAGLEYLWQRNYTSFPNGVVFIPRGTIVNGNPINCATPNCLFIGQFTGNYILLAPELSGNVNVDYLLPTSIGSFDFNIGVQYTSKYFRTIDDRLSEPAYALSNINIRWDPSDSPFYVDAWMKNMNAAEYHSFGASIGPGYLGGPAAPRTFGLTLGYNW